MITALNVLMFSNLNSVRQKDEVLTAMRRRLFQEILTEEERRRLALMEEDIEAQINMAGQGDIMHLLRQVELR